MVIDKLIGIYPNVIEDDICDYIIHTFNRLQSDKKLKRVSGKWVDGNRQFNQVMMNDKYEDELQHKSFLTNFYKKFNDISNMYFNTHIDWMSDYRRNRNKMSYLLVKKYNKNQGFFDWHCDWGGLDGEMDEISQRAYVFMLYLNDVEEGGGTEFYYSDISISPRKGTVVMFPAGVSHVHRGIVPISNDKYVLTSWLCEKYEDS